MRLPINFAEAILGCEKEVPILDGNIILKIPSFSQNNDKLRIKGRGVPYDGSNRQGDLYIILDIVMPTKLDKNQKELLEELSNSNLETSDKFKKFNKYFK